MNVIIKGVVHGSGEAILDVLVTYEGNEYCRLNVVHHAGGDVNQSDLELTKLFNAIIYAFTVNIPKNGKKPK